MASSGWNPRRFVEYLATGWRLGEPEAFLEHFRPLIHPDVISRQTLSKPRAGAEAFESQFRRIFRLFPGVTADVTSWASAEPNIYVELEVHAPGRRRPFRLNTCDRFTIRNGLITERVIHFDPAALLGYAARHPGRWPALLRAR